MVPPSARGHAAALIAGLCLCLHSGLTVAGTLPTAQAGTASVPPSRLDAPLFYQLLIGELELRQGQPGTAYAVLLDAARRTRDESLFQRAMEIALRAQAGPEALAAAQAWRAAHPLSLEAIRSQVRILLALNRLSALAEPLRSLIELTPESDRVAAVSGLPRLFQDHPDQRAALQVLQAVLIPLADNPTLRNPAQLALARSLAQAGQSSTALALVVSVARRQPESPGPALVALELLGAEPQAQSVVTDYLARPGAEAWVRLAYAQWLAPRAQLAALAEYRLVVRDLPRLAQAWYSLGLLAADAGERVEADRALQRFLELQRADTVRAAAAGPDAADGSPLDTPARQDGQGRPGPQDPQDPQGLQAQQTVQQDRAMRVARMTLSQLAIDRGDFDAAQRWLEGLNDEEWRRDVQTRRALILAKQGRLDQARALLRNLPESSPNDGPMKALAESQVMRGVERWADARAVLQRALSRHPDHLDLLYELALVLERLGRHDEMERLLRRIIELKPDHHHAHNALGYSLAERNVRLDEAQVLIKRALELAPGDPFITDSAAWLAFRQGRLEQAEELLRQAYRARADIEIGTHLAEVLWISGQRDAARQLWRDLRRRDAGNRLLRETLTRLRVDL